MAALLLQAGDMGQRTEQHTPGAEGGFTRIVIYLFIVALAFAAVLAIRLIVKGCQVPRNKRNEEN